MSRRLLIVAHAPSPNTLRLRDAAAEGARHPDIEGVETEVVEGGQPHYHYLVSFD